ncbi:MAG: MurR/RpiR family transcriptional regulator, partial [[Clostridium] symbiosum]
MENNILDTITQIKDVLPKKQRTLCNFIVLNYVEAGMMTVAELAERSGVGATTVMRLVKTLHYDSYSDFRRALLNVSLKNNASSYIGIKNSFQKASSNSDSDILHALWYDTTHTVENFITPKNIEQLDKAMTLMREASRL